MNRALAGVMALIAVSLVATGALAIGPMGAKPAKSLAVCERRPDHPKCQSPAPSALPSPSPAPSATSTPAGEPLTVCCIVVDNITQTSARITWTCNRPCTGQVEYGLTPDYGLVTTPELSFTYTTHRQTVSGLEPGTTYHFRVHSTGQSGATAYAVLQ